MKQRKLAIGDFALQVVDNQLSVSEIKKLAFVCEGFRLSRKGVTTKEGMRTLHYIADGDLTAIKKFDLFPKISDLVAELMGSKVECERLVYREIVYGDHLEYHVDSQAPGLITCLIFLNEEWHKDFHGETLFTDDSGVGISVLPLPGRIILFDGRISHSSSPPSRIFYGARKLLVLTFQKIL